MIQKNRARAGTFGERSRTRASQLTPGLRAVASYINEHREVVLERTAMGIAATLNTSDVIVIRAIQTLGFAGLRDLKCIPEQWLGPAFSSSEKVSTTVSNLTSGVNTAIDLALEGHLYTCNVLSEPENRHTSAQVVALLVQIRRVAVSGIGTSGTLADYTARLLNRVGLPATALSRMGIGLAEQLTIFQRGDVLIMTAQKSVRREGLTTPCEARRLGIPAIPLTSALDSRFSKDVSTVIHTSRGDEKGRTPLHGTVLLCLEMIVWSVASAVSQRAAKTIKRVNDFHRGLKTGRKNG